jgi:hypothetical protein
LLTNYVQVSFIKDHSHLLTRAFPASTKLELTHVELGDGALFSMLAAQANRPLSSIKLHYCKIKETAVEGAAAALARLPSLKACHVSGHTALLHSASQLTGLTHLGGGLEAPTPFADTQLVKAMTCNSGLQSLTVRWSMSVPLSAEALQCLLNSCTNLTRLDLSDLLHHCVDDQGFDLLLQHGSSITDLTLGGVDVIRSRADSTCRWQRLQLDVAHTVLAGLAYLPLKSVQELETDYFAGTLHLPLRNISPSSQLIPLLQQAVSNLVACPAWQKRPFTKVLLYSDAFYGPVGIHDSQKSQLFSALSPLAGPHLQHLAIGTQVDFDQHDVQVLARSLGSSLKSLSLRRGVIKPSFWPALAQHLPHLKELGLMHKVQVNIMGMVAYLRTLTQPFTLYIGPGVVADHTIADLTVSISAWQLHGVSVQQEHLADKREFAYLDSREALQAAVAMC